METNAKIYVAGHTGLVGSAILKILVERGFTNIVTRSHSELDLTDQAAVARFFAAERPEYVFMAAAKVGGIAANNAYRAEFIYENTVMECNVIHHSYLNGVRKLLFLGSTCIYPRDSPQPIKEDYLLTGPLEYTNEPYAIAKIAGIKMCESYNLQYGTNYLAVMPTNLYGPGDNFDLETSHVLPALIRKIYLARCIAENDTAALKKDFDRRPVNGVDGSDAQAILAILERYEVRKDSATDRVEVRVWGSGKPRREFLWSEDVADACLFVMEQVNWVDLTLGKQEIRNCHINIGTGREIGIQELARMIANRLGYTGRILFDTSKPDGTMRKLTDPAKVHALGWRHKIELEEGIGRLFEWYAGSDN